MKLGLLAGFALAPEHNDGYLIAAHIAARAIFRVFIPTRILCVYSYGLSAQRAYTLRIGAAWLPARPSFRPSHFVNGLASETGSAYGLTGSASTGLPF